MDGYKWLNYNLEQLEFFGFYEDDYPREPPNPNPAREFANNLTSNNRESADADASGQTDSSHVSHVFEIHLKGYHDEIPVVQILQYAMEILAVTGTERLGLAATAPLNTPQTDAYLWVVVETMSTRRQSAALAAALRLAKMIGMVRKEMGWFPGLPWNSPHFQMQIYDPYWPRRRGPDGQLIGG